MKHTDMNVNLQDFFWFVCFFKKKKGNLCLHSYKKL